MTRLSCKLLLSVFFLASVSAHAHRVFGSRDGAGLMVKPPVPAVDFAYHCRLHLESQGREQRSVSQGEMTITRAQIDRSDYLEIPRRAWNKHGTYHARDPRPVITWNGNLPPFNLRGHFLAFTFAQIQDVWHVSLRANVLFAPGEGAASFATADFSSKVLGARVIAAPARGGASLDLRVSCVRTK